MAESVLDTTGPQRAPHPAPPLVLDTNVVLDWLLFDDPAARPLGPAVAAGRRWLATDGMRAEFARVLRYPAIAGRLAARGADGAEALLAAFDARATRVAPAPRCGLRCADPDDQPFVDLAVAHRALLLSRDRAVLSMRKRLRGLDISVQSAIEQIAS